MAIKLSYEELVHLGKQAYREKRYDAAQSKFESALHVSKPPKLEILDFLAAVSDKLGNFEASLKYGKRMMQTNESDARVRAFIIYQDLSVLIFGRVTFESDGLCKVKRRRHIWPRKSLYTTVV